MKQILIIAKKEWLSYFMNPTGYIFAGLLVVLTAWMYFNDIFIIGQADLNNFWTTLTFLFSIFVPAITMGLLAEEKKNGNWEVLLSLPINEIRMTVGKFLGAAFFLLSTLILTVPTIVTVFLLGNPDAGVVAGGFLGILMLGLAYISTGLFCSALSNQQIVGFLTASVILIVNNLMGQEILLARLPGGLKNIVSFVSLSNRSGNFGMGLININDILFFGSWIAIFLIMTVLTLKSRDK